MYKHEFSNEIMILLHTFYFKNNEDPNTIIYTNSALNLLCGSSYANVTFATACTVLFLILIIVTFNANDLLPHCCPPPASPLSIHGMTSPIGLDGTETIEMTPCELSNVTKPKGEQPRDFQTTEVETRQKDQDKSDRKNEVCFKQL